MLPVPPVVGVVCWLVMMGTSWPTWMVAVSPLLRKGGAHGKTTAAKRRQEKIALGKALRDPDSGQ